MVSALIAPLYRSRELRMFQRKPTGGIITSVKVGGKISITPPGGLEPPTFRLTAERANLLRHGGYDSSQCQRALLNMDLSL